MRWMSMVLGLAVALLSPAAALATPPGAAEPVPFVVQLTRSGEAFGHRRALLQIDRVLQDVGADQLEIVVVAYEHGITALLAQNHETAQLVTKLAQQGVQFRACRISMNATDLSEDDFPLEVEFVDAGAPEMIMLQARGYRYWRP